MEAFTGVENKPSTLTLIQLAHTKCEWAKQHKQLAKFSHWIEKKIKV